MNHPAHSRFSRLLRAGSVAILVATGLSACSTASQNQKQTFPQRYESPRQAAPKELQPDLVRIAEVNLQLASSYYAAGQYQTAYNVINLAHQAQPENPHVLTVMALIEGEMRDDIKARQNFDRALSLAPNDPDIRHNWGVYLCRKGQPAASIEQFQRALQVPTYNRPANTMSAAGDCLARMGRDDEAQQYYTGALRFDALSAQALLGLAELKYRRGEFSQAQSSLDELNKILSESTPESLWLQIRVANRLNMAADVRTYGSDLRRLFPRHPFIKLLDNKQFD